MKRSNKKWIIISAIMLFAILGTVVIFCLFRPNENSEKLTKSDNISKNEWIKMLCEQVGMTEYHNNKPYFNDVDENDAYFAYIQSAAEWGVLDTSSDFDGESLVSGKDIALTAMKTLGQKKIQIYLETDKDVTEDVYLALATEHGLVAEEQFAKGFSKKECEEVLEKLQELYFGVFWKDDYSVVKYREGVVELSRNDVLQSDVDCLKVTVTKDVADSLETGTIIVLEQSSTKLKIARKVTNISSNGDLLLIPTELTDTVESLIVSDIKELTFEDIANYYGYEESTNKVKNYNIIQTKNFSFEKQSKGFKISLSVKEKDNEKSLEIKATDNATNVSYTLPVNIPIDADHEYSAELNIDKMCVGAQVASSRVNLVEYADVALDVHATTKGELKISKDQKILLFKTPVPLGNGAVGVDIQLYLVLSVEGSISFEVELPFQTSVHYEAGKGIRKGEHDNSVKKPIIEANCKAGLTFRFEPILTVLGFNVLDVEADVGISAEAKAITRPNAQMCADIAILFPIIKLSACGDDDLDTIVGALGISGEWDIITSDKALFRLGLHYEIFPNKKAQFVEQCTYKEEKEDSSEVELSQEELSQEEQQNETKNTYYTQYGDNRFAFDYSDDWTIDTVESDEIFRENVVLKSKDITLTYWEFNTFPLGGGGHAAMTNAEVTKIRNSEIENFMIGKMQIIGETDMLTGEEYLIENGNVSYAVMPEDYVGIHDSMVGLSGIYEECSFPFGASRYMLLVESSNGQFTKEEEKEVIKILSSFRKVQ